VQTAERKLSQHAPHRRYAAPRARAGAWLAAPHSGARRRGGCVRGGGWRGRGPRRPRRGSRSRPRSVRTTRRSRAGPARPARPAWQSWAARPARRSSPLARTPMRCVRRSRLCYLCCRRRGRASTLACAGRCPLCCALRALCRCAGARVHSRGQRGAVQHLCCRGAQMGGPVLQWVT